MLFLQSETDYLLRPYKKNNKKALNNKEVHGNWKKKSFYPSLCIKGFRSEQFL